MDLLLQLRMWVAAYWAAPPSQPAFGRLEEDANGVVVDSDTLDDDTLREVAAKILRKARGGVPSLSMPGMELPRSGPTIIDVLLVALGRSSTACKPPCPPNLWAPSVDECAEAKCQRVPTSAMLVPEFSRELMKAVYCAMPEEIRVRPTDSIATLVRRLSQSHFLDDMRVQRKGRGGEVTERLNATTMAQPRRVTMSVRVSPTFGTEDDEEVHYLFDYMNFKRREVDKQCRPMPSAIFDLGVACWMAAYDYLTPTSKQCPFTHCQLLVYYECFNGRMGQHRDNANSRLMSNIVNGITTELETPLVGHESQWVGSNVVVFSLGTGIMQFLLRYPHADNIHESRSDYVIHERFRIPLGPGTLFVLDPWDDVYFTHEAYFDVEYDEVGESTWREAYVFRHVCSLGLFHTFAEEHKLYMSEEVCTKIRTRKRARASAKANSRRRLFQSMF